MGSAIAEPICLRMTPVPACHGIGRGAIDGDRICCAVRLQSPEQLYVSTGLSDSLQG
jgi:hypothetical protein